jgi:hypothetical protein
MCCNLHGHPAAPKRCIKTSYRVSCVYARGRELREQDVMLLKPCAYAIRLHWTSHDVLDVSAQRTAWPDIHMSRGCWLQFAYTPTACWA